jgi:hypothetical protein
MNLPKTLIIGVTTHGEIHLDNNCQPLKYAVPENMYINIINASVPGVPNISKLENYEDMSERISQKINTITNWDTFTKSDVNQLSTNLQQLLIEENQEQSADLIKIHQKLYNKGIKDVNMERFSHHYDKAFSISTFEHGDYMPNKLYVKFEPNELDEMDKNIEQYYINKIILYNAEGEPDIFNLFETIGFSLNAINVGDLISFLQPLGVQNLLIIDLSCYVFKSSNDNCLISDTQIRYLRRTMKKGGKKYTLKQLKKNSNKYRKSRHRQSRHRRSTHRRSTNRK